MNIAFYFFSFGSQITLYFVIGEQDRQ